jgi:hypothetical protein
VNKFLSVSTGGSILKKDYPGGPAMSDLENALSQRRKRKRKKQSGAVDEATLGFTLADE